MASVTRPAVTQIRPTQLVEETQSGRIRVPHFQRPFRWEARDVELLFDSILRGYPIGNLLMWERSAPEEEITIGEFHINAPANERAWLVVDGQQRLTGLVGALTANTETTDPRFRIFYDLNTKTFISLPRTRRPQPHQLPVSTAVDNLKLISWQRERPWLTREHFDLCDSIATAIRQYEIPVYVVTGDDETALKNIFDRMNTFGKRLSRAEVFRALHTVADGRTPADLDSLADTGVGLGFGRIPQRLLMQSLMATREGKIDRDFRREFKNDTARHEAFKITEKALGEAIAFLRERCGMPHVRLLPYALFLPVMVRFAALFGEPSGRASELLVRWVWRGSTIPIAPHGNTAAVRNYTAAVHDDPLDSAVRLLDLLPQPHPNWQWEPDLSQIAINRSQAKLNVLALLESDPVLLEPQVDEQGEVIAGAESPVRSINVLGKLLDEHQLLLQPIIGGPAPLLPLDAQGLANRVLHPAFSEGQALPVLLSGTVSRPGLESHVIDQEQIGRLQRMDAESFLNDRSERLKRELAERVQRRALWGFNSPRGPISLFALSAQPMLGDDSEE